MKYVVTLNRRRKKAPLAQIRAENQLLKENFARQVRMLAQDHGIEIDIETMPNTPVVFLTTPEKNLAKMISALPNVRDVEENQTLRIQM